MRLDWGALVSHFIHPTKLTVIEAMLWIDRPLSATELTLILDRPVSLSSISYHLETLVKLALIEEVETRKVRGATEHFFCFTDAMRVAG